MTGGKDTIRPAAGLVFAESVADLVGDTPLVRLRRVTEGVRPLVLAKLEYLNPGGSVKDRIALAMVEAAEEAGQLRPGGTIVEPTSGNTGVGLAFVAQARGYRCVFTCPDKVSADRINVLRALGAEVIICPAAVPPDDPRSYRSVSDRIARELPGGCKLDQYANPNNALAHYAGTGPEIWRQTAGRLTHFVAGIGTGGTVTGVGRFLKEASRGAVRVIGADPDGSVYSGGTGRPYLLEGVGQPTFPAAYDRSAPDEVIAVSDYESLTMTRRLAREESLLVGGSSGMAVVAALRAATGLTEDAVVLVLLPDSGRGYLSKVFSDDWMAALGMIGSAASGPRAADILSWRGSAPVPYARPGDPVGHAIAAMRRLRLAHLVVTRAEPPFRLAEVLGTVTEQDLARALLARHTGARTEVEHCMSAPLPQVGSGQSAASVVSAMSGQGAVLVMDRGQVAGVLTHADLMGFLADRHEQTHEEGHADGQQGANGPVSSRARIDH